MSQGRTPDEAQAAARQRLAPSSTVPTRRPQASGPAVEDTRRTPAVPAAPVSNGAANGSGASAPSANGAAAPARPRPAEPAQRPQPQGQPQNQPQPQPQATPPPADQGGPQAAAAAPSAASKKPAAAKKTSKSPAKKTAAKKTGRTRKARLRLVQVDAWSVMKTAFLLSIAIGIVTVVAVMIVWAVLGAAGVWDSVNSIVQQVVGSDNSKAFRIQDYLGTSRVMGITMILAVLDVVLITAIATLSAFLYNLAATLLGGVEVTLAEDH